MGRYPRQSIQAEVSVRPTERPTSHQQTVARHDQVMRSVDSYSQCSDHGDSGARVEESEMDVTRSALPADKAVTEADYPDEHLETAAQQMATYIEQQTLIISKQASILH